MKAMKVCMVALAVLASATMAQAGATVWYSATGNNAASGGGPGGALSTLNLTCDTSGGGNCSWNVTMNLTLSPGGGESWATDLTGLAGSGLGVSAPTSLANPYNSAASGGAAGPPPALLTGSQGASFAVGGVPAGTYALISFTLTRTSAAGDLSGTNITALNGGFEWATSGN